MLPGHPYNTTALGLRSAVSTAAYPWLSRNSNSTSSSVDRLFLIAYTSFLVAFSVARPGVGAWPHACLCGGGPFGSDRVQCVEVVEFVAACSAFPVQRGLSLFCSRFDLPLRSAACFPLLAAAAPSTFHWAGASSLPACGFFRSPVEWCSGFPVWLFLCVRHW